MTVQVTRVCYPFVGDSVGGSQLSTMLLIDRLDRERYEPVVVTHQPGPLDDELARRGVVAESLALPRLVGEGSGPLEHGIDVARTAVPVARFLRRHRIDLVHANDSRTNMTWLGGSALTHVRHVWHQRSAFADSGLMRLGVRRADAVVVNSGFVGATLPGGVEVHVVSNPCEAVPVDRSTSRAALLGALGRRDDPVVVGFVGRVLPMKRLDVFIRIGAELRRRLQRPLALPVVGTISPEERVGAESLAAELSVAEHLTFLGFRSPVEPWLAGLDVLVSPAEGDAFGRTLVEAMLCGTPVVAARSGGHTEIVDHGRNGWLFDPGDVLGAAGEVERRLGDLLATESVVMRARMDATRRWSPEAHAVAVAGVYEGVLR